MRLNPNVKPILVVQGGWWGSEAKGLVTHKLTLEKSVDVAIRTGTVNAGHTVYHNGAKYPMQQLPVSWVRPETKLVLGPGAYVHPEILKREIYWISEALGITTQEVCRRIKIDFNCGLHLEEHTERSTRSGRHQKMGATGKGSSEAVIDKIYGRGEDGRNFNSWAMEMAQVDEFWAIVYDSCMADTVLFVNLCFDGGQQLLIEGTQGTLLDLHIGPYPYTTHKQTQAANWMAEAGLSLTLPTELWLVLRTFPIRVFGNSGPLPNEISWEELWVEIDSKLFWAGKGGPDRPSFQIPLEEFQEKTTVTKKVRRIARWDWPTFSRTITLNRPHKLAITFMNYEFPALWGCAGNHVGLWGGEVRAYLDQIEHYSQCDIGMTSFGPQVENCFMEE